MSVNELAERELTNAQIDQIDHVQEVAYQAMCELLWKEPEWNMEWIGEISDALVAVACKYFDCKEEELYPHLENYDPT